MAQANYNAYAKYIELRNSGMNPFEALRQAFPEGMMSPEERAKRAAGQDQSSALGQMAGLGVGVIGARALQDALAGERVLGGLRDSIFGAEGEKGIGGRLVDAFTPDGGAASGGGGAGGLSVAEVGPNLAATNIGTATQAFPVGTTAEGATLMSDGSVFQGSMGPQPDAAAAATGGFSGANLLQGGLGALQGYMGYRQFQQGDKIGGALGMAGGAANLAGAAGMDTIGSAAGPIGAAYGAYTLGKMATSGDYTTKDTGSLALQGGAAGASIGSAILPGPGTAIGAAIGGTIGAITGLSGSKKGQRQLIRDKWRKSMLENNVGLFGQDYKGTLVDGSTFDWGKDKFSFGKGEGAIDLDNPTVGKAAAYGNVLAAIHGAGSGKAGEAIATQYTAASTTNAQHDLGKVQNNYRMFMDKLGINQASGQQQLDKMYNEGKLSEDRYKIYSNDLREMMAAPATQTQRRR